MNVGRDLMDILETVRRNQEQIDLLTANNTRLTSHLLQTGLIQNLGGLSAIQQILNGATVLDGLAPKKRLGRPPLKALAAMGVPVEHVERLGITDEERNSYAQTNGVDSGPSKVAHTRKSVTSGGNSRYVKVYENDPEEKYSHKPDGSIVLLGNGSPRKRGGLKRGTTKWTPERRAAFSKMQRERMAKLTPREKVALVNKRLKTMREKQKRGE